jgi:integrase
MRKSEGAVTPEKTRAEIGANTTMATVFKRKLTRWVLNGKRVTKSTTGAIAHSSHSREWYGLVKGRYVKLSPIRDVAEQMLRKIIRESEERRIDQFAAHRQAPLADHIAKFRDHLESTGRSPRYIRETIQRLKVVTFNCTLLEHVIADRVDACLNDLARQRHGDRLKKASVATADGAATSTRNSYLAAVKSFCSWCVRTRRMPDNPLSHLSKLNEATDVRRERRTLLTEEFARLIDTTNESTETIRGLTGVDRAMLYLMAVGTGLRASELGSLNTASLSVSQELPTVVVEAGYSKRRRRDEQPLPTWLADRLRKWLAARPSQLIISTLPHSLWPGSWSRHAAKMLRGDLEAAGLVYRDGTGRVFDFHALRHQFISNLADAGVHPRTAQELARHSSIELTMKRYTHLAMRNVVVAVESVPEPLIKGVTARRATGTGDRRSCDRSEGDAQVTAKASSSGHNCHLSHNPRGNTLRPGSTEKPLLLQGPNEAEGTGLEPATPYGAPHFQCGR